MDLPSEPEESGRPGGLLDDSNTTQSGRAQCTAVSMLMATVTNIK